MEENDFIVDLITLEVGSRSFVNYDGFYCLKDEVGATPKDLNDLLLSFIELVDSTCHICNTLQNVNNLEQLKF